MRLLKFGSKNGLFIFPAQSAGRDNFTSMVTKTSRLPGVDGGYSEYKGRRGFQEIGSVSSNLQLLNSPDKPMREARDQLAAVLHWGTGLLFTDIWADARQDKRYCLAQPDNFDFNENVQQVPHVQQKVPVTFQVTDPGWRGGQKRVYMDSGVCWDDGYFYEGAIYYDEGYRFDSGLYFNAPKLDAQAQSGNVFTVTNRGTRSAVARLTISATEPEWVFGGTLRFGDGHYFDGAVGPVSNINVKFTANGTLDTSWTWGDTLQPGEFLIIDGETQSVKVRGRTDRSGYPSFQRHKGYGFINVPPGDSTLQISGGIGERGCRVVLEFRDTFYTS